jgi:hypothetical protein
MTDRTLTRFAKEISTGQRSLTYTELSGLSVHEADLLVSAYADYLERRSSEERLRLFRRGRMSAVSAGSGPAVIPRKCQSSTTRSSGSPSKVTIDAAQSTLMVPALAIACVHGSHAAASRVCARCRSSQWRDACC